MPPGYPLRVGRLVLASGSPRRQELLGRLGLAFEVVVPDVDETPLPAETPHEHVARLAAAKARKVAAGLADATIIGADTAVDVDGEILGKPGDADAAAEMLVRLSGRHHLVHTGVAVTRDGHVATSTTTSEVTFKALTDGEIEWYVATGEPLDKAGAYGLQGIGGAFVQSMHGSVTGVLGLPLAETLRILAAVSNRGL